MSEQSESAVNGAKAAHSKRSLYTVFFALGEFDDEAHALEGASWSACGEFVVTDNMGQRSARRQALSANPELRERIDSGEVVWFLCVPRRSLHPFKSEMKTADPRLVI